MTTLERTATGEPEILQCLKRTAAKTRVDERELVRAIFRASVNPHITQRQISDVVGTRSQATVQRTVRRIAEDPTLLEKSPAETIDMRAAEMIDTKTMMKDLLNWKYTFGRVPSIDGTATDAYISGDWNDIELAYYRDLLTEDEFGQLVDRQKVLLEQASTPQ